MFLRARILCVSSYESAQAVNAIILLECCSMLQQHLVHGRIVAISSSARVCFRHHSFYLLLLSLGVLLDLSVWYDRFENSSLLAMTFRTGSQAQGIIVGLTVDTTVSLWYSGMKTFRYSNTNLFIFCCPRCRWRHRWMGSAGCWNWTATRNPKCPPPSTWVQLRSRPRSQPASSVGK